ncbi:hypothetical protein VTK26DRAFT_8863 [Humicola hyalothermophila]
MNDRPFTLQPRSVEQRGPQSFSEFIQRVNAEPGGFRSLDLAEISREVEARRNNADRDEDLDMAAAASEAESDDAETKDVIAAREELLRTIHLTHQTGMLALDFVSLLLSKENPAQAVATLSPVLRDMVGVGTLGATVLDAPTALTQSRVPDNKMVAIGKRLMDLNKAADTALAASKRLQQEIGSETKYWSQVMAVQENGWRTFRLPHEPNTMAVKFGFSNAGPEFKANSVAPMRREKDGSVRLEHGKLGGGSKRLRVSILDNDVVVGRSSLPRPLPPDAPLEDRVKEARDTIFAEELWHEISRDARTLLSRGFRIGKSAITYALDERHTVSIELVSLNEDEGSAPEQPGSQDAMAESLYISLCLLLSHAHRANEQRRSEPGGVRRNPRAYSLLSSLLSYYEYDKTVQRCTQSVAAYTRVLRSAGLDASVVITEPPLSPLPGAPASTSLAAVLLKPPTVQYDLTITPDARVQVLLRPSPLHGSDFSVTCPPPAQPGSKNPLASPPQPPTDEYVRIEDLLWFLYSSVPRALTAHYKAVLSGSNPAVGDSGGAAQDGKPDRPSWAISADEKALVDFDTGKCGIEFDFGPNPSTGRLELSARGDLIEDGKKAHREWIWPGHEEGLGAVVKRVLEEMQPRQVKIEAF